MLRGCACRKGGGIPLFGSSMFLSVLPEGKCDDYSQACEEIKKNLQRPWNDDVYSEASPGKGVSLCTVLR